VSRLQSTPSILSSLNSGSFINYMIVSQSANGSIILIHTITPYIAACTLAHSCFMTYCEALFCPINSYPECIKYLDTTFVVRASQKLEGWLHTLHTTSWLDYSFMAWQCLNSNKVLSHTFFLQNNIINYSLATYTMKNTCSYMYVTCK